MYPERLEPLLIAVPDVPPEVLGVSVVGAALGLGALLLCLILWVATIVSVMGSTYSLGMKLLLIIACFAFPVLGPLAWFVIVKGNQPTLATVHRR